MLKQLTSAQLTELEAFWQIEGGWGEYKEDYRNAQLMSLQANMNRNSKKAPKPFKMEDFVLRPKESNTNTKEAEKRIRASFDSLAGVKAKRQE